MKRTCSNCCSYEASEGCMNGVLYPAKPGDRCEEHETQAEFDANAKAIARFRQKMGLPPRRPFILGDDSLA